MNKWNEKEVRVTAELTTVAEIIYKDVYLLTDKDTQQLHDKIIYYFFDQEHSKIFPHYQSRQWVYSVSWRPISREAIEEVLKVFLAIQDAHYWEAPLEITIVDTHLKENAGNMENHFLAISVEASDKESLSLINSLCQELKKKHYKAEVITKYWGETTCRIWYKTKVEDTMEDDSW